MEKFNLRSLLLYVCKQYKWLVAAAFAGMILLSALNILKGQNYSDKVKETDVISKEELEDSRQELEIAQNNLKNLEVKLENQQIVLTEYEENLSEYNAKWKEDIYMQTNADGRYGVKTVYQFKALSEGPIDQTLNAIKAALESMYNEIADEMTGAELTAYNVQRLFAVEVNLNQNQIVMKTSYETEKGLSEIQSLYHAWMDKKLAEYQEKYPSDALEMTISEENEYIYYDTDIFNEQRTAADKRISIQNNIVSTNNAITTAQNDIVTTKTKIKELNKTLKANEKLWDNTIVISEGSGKMISKTSVIIYLVLGAVVGILIGSIFFTFRYIYGGTLRDTEDMRCRSGENVIGTLYSPVYRPGKDRLLRKLDQWDGVDEISNMEEQFERLAVDIQLQLRQLGKNSLVLTGTTDGDTLNKVGSGLEKYLKDTSVSIYTGANPVYTLETAQRLITADVVVTIEKIGYSKVNEIRKLRTYLEESHVQVLGGITI